MYKVKQTVEKIISNGGMTQQEIEFYFNEYYKDKQQGNIKNSEARAILILTHRHLIYVAFDMLNVKLYNEDLISVAKIGLIYAVDSFDINKGYKFMTYVLTCIKNELASHFRHENRKSATGIDIVSLNEEIVNFEKKSLKLEDMLADKEDMVETVLTDIITNEQLVKLKQSMLHLKPVEQVVLIYSYGLFGNKVMKQKELAEELEMTANYVKIAHDNAIKKLSVLMSNYQDLSFDDKLIYNDCLSTSFPNVNLKNCRDFKVSGVQTLASDEFYALVIKAIEELGYKKVESLVMQLSVKERNLICYRYGLFGKKRVMVSKLKEVLNLKETQIRAYLDTAKKRFSKMLNDELNNKQAIL